MRGEGHAAAWLPELSHEYKQARVPHMHFPAAWPHTRTWALASREDVRRPSLPGAATARLFIGVTMSSDPWLLTCPSGLRFTLCGIGRQRIVITVTLVISFVPPRHMRVWKATLPSPGLNSLLLPSRRLISCRKAPVCDILSLSPPILTSKHPCQQLPIA